MNLILSNVLIKLSNKGSPILPIYYLGCDFNIKILKMIVVSINQLMREREREREEMAQHCLNWLLEKSPCLICSRVNKIK